VTYGVKTDKHSYWLYILLKTYTLSGQLKITQQQ